MRCAQRHREFGLAVADVDIGAGAVIDVDTPEEVIAAGSCWKAGAASHDDSRTL